MKMNVDNVPASGLPSSSIACCSASFCWCSREEDRAKATMVSSSSGSSFCLSFFRACWGVLEEPFLLVPPASELERSNSLGVRNSKLHCFPAPGHSWLTLGLQQKHSPPPASAQPAAAQLEWPPCLRSSASSGLSDSSGTWTSCHRWDSLGHQGQQKDEEEEEVEHFLHSHPNTCKWESFWICLYTRTFLCIYWEWKESSSRGRTVTIASL